MLTARTLVIAMLFTSLVTALSVMRIRSSGVVPPIETPPAPEATAAKTPRPLFVQGSVPNVDSRSFVLGPYGAVEFGYVLEKDAALIYEWKSTKPVEFDFHTEPAGKPPEASDSFEADQAAEGHGGYIAPYAGIHGWFWQNGTNAEVTLTLTATGFFTKAILYKDDGTTETVPITPPGARRARPKS